MEELHKRRLVRELRLRTAVDVKKYATYLNLLKTKRGLFYLKAQFVPRCKHLSTRL
jgi:hypothetical protein